MTPRIIKPPTAAQYRYQRAVYRGKSISGSPRLRWTVVAILVSASALHIVFGEGGVLRGNDLRDELVRTEESIEDLQARVGDLQTRIKLQEDDPFSLEKLAREKYGMARPGERIYRFEEREAPPPDVTDTGP